MKLGAVSEQQMAQVDQIMVDELGITLDAMIENAGFLLAFQATKMLTSVRGSEVIVLAGPGHNGADAIAAARRLAIWGAQPIVILSAPRDKLKGATFHQLTIAENSNVRVYEPEALIPQGQLVIDGLVGYGLAGKLRDTAADLAISAMQLKVPILSVDVPSGLDITTGKADQPAIRADVTLTLGYPKLGLVKDFAKNMIGTLLVGDVSIPATLWQRLGLVPPDFSTSFLIEI